MGFCRQEYWSAYSKRWWRNRTGRPLFPSQIPQKNISMLSKLHKTTSESGRGHQATTFRLELKKVGKNTRPPLAYLTYMQSTSWETLGWKKHKVESRLPGELSITSDMWMSMPPWLLSRKESTCNAGDLGSISGLGRSPGRGNDNPLQYSCLENPMGRGAWWATVHGVAKSWTWLSN